MGDDSLPVVSIVMPVRNEADFIGRAVRSVLENDYPRDKMEVIVADGCSRDGTRAVVEKIAAKDSRVRVIDNTGRIVSTGLNTALKASKGDVFIRVDGHAEVTRDFIRKSVMCLLEHDEAWVAGGCWNTVSEGYVGKVIAAATHSPVGVGDSRHRLGNFDGWVDTVPYGAHHRWVPDRIGYFDEELVRNQDDEFNMRIILAGGKIWMSSAIRSTYYSRSSLKKLWRQYFQYGFWRTRTLQKHRRPAKSRQVVPALFVGVLIFLTLGALILPELWWALAAVLVVYGAGLVYGSVDVGRRAGWRYALLAPVVFVVLHFGYGVGCLWGIVRFIVLRGRFMARPGEVRMSR